MKYSIADIVRYEKDNSNSYLITATKDQPLNISFLESKTGKFTIDAIEKLAEKEVTVAPGFEYRIVKTLGSKNGNATYESKFIDVFESDLFT